MTAQCYFEKLAPASPRIAREREILAQGRRATVRDETEKLRSFPG